MNFPDYFPIWDQLNQDQQGRLQNSVALRSAPKGTVLHNGDMDCTGLLLVKSGQLRAYILSDEGREITLYRLFDRDMWRLMEESAPVANYTNELMASRFSEVMWLMEQIMWKSPILRGHVADGADHVEEPGQTAGILLAGGGGY